MYKQKKKGDIINELGVHEVEEDYSDDEEPGDLIEASESNYDEDDLLLAKIILFFFYLSIISILIIF